MSKWISKYLTRENLYLVVYGATVSVFDFMAPLMILSEASIQDLNSKLSSQVSVRNFRPNILLEGCNAYEEVVKVNIKKYKTNTSLSAILILQDDWANFRIKNSEFRKLRYCTRCLPTTVDPEKGIKSAD